MRQGLVKVLSMIKNTAFLENVYICLYKLCTSTCIIIFIILYLRFILNFRCSENIIEVFCFVFVFVFVFCFCFLFLLSFACSFPLFDFVLFSGNVTYNVYCALC